MTIEAGTDVEKDAGTKQAGVDGGAPKKAVQKPKEKRIDAGTLGIDGGGYSDAGDSIGAFEGFATPPNPYQGVISGIAGLLCCSIPLLPFLILVGAHRAAIRSRSANTKFYRDITRPFRR